MDKENDYYKILQIDPSAEQEVIEAAYRRLSLKYHPDQNKSPDANRRMQDINAAYEVLRDPVLRAEYDKKRPKGQGDNSYSQSFYQAETERKKREAAENARKNAEQKAENYRKAYESERNKNEASRRSEAREQAENERRKREEAENARKYAEQKSEAYKQEYKTERRINELREKSLKHLITKWLKTILSGSLEIEKILGVILVILTIIVAFIVVNDWSKARSMELDGPVIANPTSTIVQEKIKPEVVITNKIKNTETVEPMEAITSAVEQANLSGRLLFEDNFNDENSLMNWSPYSGSWIVNGGICYLSGSTGYMSAGDKTWTDYEFSVDIKGENVFDKIINVRHLDAGNLYEINLRAEPFNDVVLSKLQTSGGSKQLLSAHYENKNSTWYTIRSIVTGANLTVYINGDLVISYTDLDQPILSGKILIGGIIKPGGRILFDNVKVISN